MEKDKLNIEETTLAVDLSEATDAVKNGSFEHALSLLKIILKEHPDHIDSLYPVSYTHLTLPTILLV